MKPAPFEYYAPETLQEAIALLAGFEEDGVEAKILAGGQSLMPMLSLRVARPEVLVDLRKLAELHYIRDEGDTIAIGSMTSKRAAEEFLRRSVDYGLQPDAIGATRLFVLPSPSGAARRYWSVQPWHALARMATQP